MRSKAFAVALTIVLLTLLVIVLLTHLATWILPLEQVEPKHSEDVKDVVLESTYKYTNIAKSAKFYIREYYGRDLTRNDGFTLIKVNLPTAFSVYSIDDSLIAMAISLNGSYNYAIVPIPVTAAYATWINFEIWVREGYMEYLVGRYSLDVGWHPPFPLDTVDSNLNPIFSQTIKLRLNPPYTINTTKVYLHKGFVIVSLPPTIAKKMTRVYVDGNTLFDGSGRDILLIERDGWYNLTILSNDFIVNGNYTLYLINTLHNTTVIPVKVEVEPKYRY